MLLGLAHFFGRYTPKYTLMFAALSGLNQIMSGSRWFVEDFYFRENSSIGKEIIAQVNLDLSTDSVQPVHSAKWSHRIGGRSVEANASNIFEPKDGPRPIAPATTVQNFRKLLRVIPLCNKFLSTSLSAVNFSSFVLFHYRTKWPLC